ncbi:MAG: response regulator [Sphaerochaeta sp.]|nr:response regulator [Sphaerochaeta sp.]
MRILIVDDEIMIREWLHQTILSLPFPFEYVKTASNGVEALSLMKTSTFDLVFIDIKMPKMNGIQLLKQVHETYPKVITIMLTSYEEFKYAQDALRYHASDYILKSECTKDKLAEVLGLCMENKTQPAGSRIGTDSIRELLLHQRSQAFTHELIRVFSSLEGKNLFVTALYPQKNTVQKELVTMFSSPDGVITPVGEVGEFEGVTYMLFSLGQITTSSNQALLKQGYMQYLHETASAVVSCGKTVQGVQEIHTSLTHAYYGLRSLFYSNRGFCSEYSSKQQLDKQVVEHLCGDATDAIRNYNRVQTEILVEALKKYFKATRPTCIEYVKDTFFTLVSTYIVFNCKDPSEVHMKLNNLKGVIHSIGSYDKLLELTHNFLEGDEQSYYKKYWSPAVAEAIKYIENNYHTIYSAIDVADHVELTLDHFSRMFKKELGVPVSTYLINYKLDVAALMIKSSNLSIKEIAQKVGISNVSYFSKRFKEKFSMQPIVYRMHAT